MQDYRKLNVWHRSHQLTLDVYRVTKAFPPDERFGLTSQLRRAAMSIPSNIAEGAGRIGNAEFGRFLSIASGSASEVEYQLLLAHELGYLSTAAYKPLNALVDETKRMLGALLKRVRK